MLSYFFNMKRLRHISCAREGIQGEKQKFFKGQNVDRNRKKLIGTGSKTTKQKLKSLFQ